MRGRHGRENCDMRFADGSPFANREMSRNPELSRGLRGLGYFGGRTLGMRSEGIDGREELRSRDCCIDDALTAGNFVERIPMSLQVAVPRDRRGSEKR